MEAKYSHLQHFLVTIEMTVTVNGEWKGCLLSEAVCGTVVTFLHIQRNFKSLTAKCI